MALNANMDLDKIIVIFELKIFYNIQALVLL
jgi:hypothetical protein